MTTYVRLNDADEVVETREFTDDEVASAKAFLKTDTYPADISHKCVRWRPRVEIGRDAINTLTEDASVSVVITADAYELHFTAVPKDLQPFKDHAERDLRRQYREKLLDALPDLKAIKAIVDERDAKVAVIHAETNIMNLIPETVSVAKG